MAHQLARSLSTALYLSSKFAGFALSGAERVAQFSLEAALEFEEALAFDHSI